MEDYSPATQTHKTPHRSIGFVYIIPLGLVLGFFIFAAVYILKGNSLNFTATTTPTPTTPFHVQASPIPTGEVTPTATVKATIAKDELKITVLNGSGVAGAAGKVADFLKGQDYTSVKTGNADEVDFKNITIHYAKEAKSNALELQTLFEKSYTVDTIEESDVSSGTEVEIIVGKLDKKDEE